MIAQPVSKDAYDCPEFLIPRKEKASNLYGYVDIGGNYIIPPTYIQAGYFQGKNARVQLGKKFGVINCEGRLVVPATFDVIDDFVNGFGWVQQNGKWGLMRSDGHLEVPPAFDSVNAVSRRSGFTWVYKDSIWGIFDKDSRKMIIKPTYKMYRGVTDSLIIGRYDAWFDIVDLKKQLAIIDSATEVVRLTPHVLGYRKRRWGLVDVRGRIELPPQADTMLTDGNNIIAWQHGRPSLYSRFGKRISVKFPVDSLALTGSPLVRYRTKNGHGLLNGNGRKVFVNEYDQVIGPIGRYALLKKGKWFVYRQGSKKVDVVAYDSVQALSGGRYFALYGQRTAAVYSSTAGQVFMPGTVTWVQNDTGVVVRCTFSGGSQGLLNLKTGTPFNPNKPATFDAPQAPLFAYTAGGKRGIVGYAAPKLVAEAEFDHVQTLTYQGRPVFAGTKGGEIVVRDANNRPVIQKEIKGGLPVIPFNSSGFFFKRKGEYGGVALSGDEVVKPGYDTVLIPQENNPQVFLGRNGGTWSLVGTDGKKIVSDLKNAYFLGFSMLTANQRGANKVLDYTGGEKKAPAFDSIMAFTENLAAYKTGGNWGFLNRQLAPSLPPQYESVTPFYKGKSVVRAGGLYGLIDSRGKYLLKPKFRQYSIRNGVYDLR